MVTGFVKTDRKVEEEELCSGLKVNHEHIEVNYSDCGSLSNASRSRSEGTSLRGILDWASAADLQTKTERAKKHLNRVT